MSLSASKTLLFSSGSISFSSLRSSFRENSSGSIKASELRRNTSLSDTNPVVPDSTENASISSGSNLKFSQFRNSIKYYDLNQSGTDLNLNIASGSWNSNLNKNIIKRVNITGTCGSTNGNPAATLDAAAVYNVLLIISGSILGSGGSAGNQDTGTNGGNGGNALYINTNGTGTVTVRTSGGSAQVYGGGGGGGGGGDGGTGANGVYYTSGSSYWANTVCSGPACYGLNPPFDCNGGGGCRRLRDCQGGQTLWERYCTNVYTITNYTSGGSGGQGTVGGIGQGYLQTRTFASNPPTLGQPSGPTSGGTNAGNGGEGGKGGDGGYWGENGGNGNTGNTGGSGNNGNPTGGTGGTSGGSPGRAVSGSGYAIDPNGVESAYIGLK